MSSDTIKLIEAENISPSWRRCHILFLICAAIFGMCSGIILSLMMEDHNFLCAKIYLEETKVNGTDVVALDGTLIKIITGETYMASCEFSQYTFISSFIFGSIWMVFFMMCGPGGKADTGLPQPWRIVCPALIFTTVFWMVTIGAGAQLTLAIDDACSNFDSQLLLILNRTSSEECEDMDVFYQIKAAKYVKVQTLMLIAEVTSWLCCISWGVSSLICILRILLAPDFHPMMMPASSINEHRISTVLYDELRNSSSSQIVSEKLNQPSTSKAWIHDPPRDLSDTVTKQIRFDDEVAQSNVQKKGQSRQVGVESEKISLMVDRDDTPTLSRRNLSLGAKEEIKVNDGSMQDRKTV